LSVWDLDLSLVLSRCFVNAANSMKKRI